ncbi:DBH-like monooxygenase protein 1 homolog [Lingula anatina]|uniref:DBH-like monooxygenase protein 1 homolog n=1 Tax=Lingula anatina TaxID=7574 RepID=A0A1S3HQC2_LINAN|nr:DBH-like monooxygenase protein 1 homolog [Lingula anatina]|eukprot:XP_013388237.1 DBH-like monooxygenase protein 1 homolog [Lingula anatina]
MIFTRAVIVGYFLLSVVFAQATSTGSDGFTHSIVLKEDAYHLLWKFDDLSITFEAQVKTTGYVGLGFSPSGGMSSADIVLGWVKDGQAYLKDSYAISKDAPKTDDNQDVELLSGSENGTFTTLRFRRKLDTCDPRDFVITTSTVRLIWSYHLHDPDTDMDLRYHGYQNRGTKSVHLLAPAQPSGNMADPPDAYHVEMRNTKVHLPATKDTIYWCNGFKPPATNGVHHVIKFNAIIQPGNEEFVHHLILYACFHDFNTTAHDRKEWECYTPNMPPTMVHCYKPFIGWAIGSGEFRYPPHVGQPFGGEGDPTFLILETHYDNPAKRRGVIDSSGLRLTFIPRRRQFDAGIIQTGVLVNLTNHNIPPYYSKFYNWGQCDSGCLSEAMKNRTNEIHVFATLLHTHLIGSAVYVRHFRGQVELPWLSHDGHYDFNYQEYRHLPKEVTVKPGDTIVTYCQYNSARKKNFTWGGFGTREEMCQGYIAYYPKLPLSTCNSAPLQSHLAEVLPDIKIASHKHGLFIKVEGPEKYVNKTFKEVLQTEVDWQDKRVRMTYQNLTVNGSHFFACTGANLKKLYIGQTLSSVKPYFPPKSTDCRSDTYRDHRINQAVSSECVKNYIAVFVALALAMRFP